MKNRTTFTVAGSHPHLWFLRNHLILQGLALVDLEQDPDFFLVGGRSGWELAPHVLADKPVLLLSSDCVYSDRDFTLAVRDKSPMREEEPLLVTNPLDPRTTEILSYARAENYFLLRKKTMVLRIFNTYGPDLRDGLIFSFLDKIQNGETIKLYNPGYQIRTFLHQDDFLGYFDAMLLAFLKGSTGVFNLGSTDEISIKRLIDSLTQLTGHTINIELIKPPPSYRWWVLPDMTRTKAVSRYEHNLLSLRGGLWSLTRD